MLWHVVPVWPNGESVACVLGVCGGEGCVDQVRIYDEPSMSLALGYLWISLCELPVAGKRGDLWWS
jgi:hypothetical protein